MLIAYKWFIFSLLDNQSCLQITDVFILEVSFSSGEISMKICLVPSLSTIAIIELEMYFELSKRYLFNFDISSLAS